METTPPEAPPRRLTRSTSDRMVGGVCGGLAEYTGIDPVVFRVVIAVAALLGGAGLAAYLLAWLIIPETGQESHAESLLRNRDIPRVVLAVVGVIALIAAANVLDGAGHRHIFGGGFSLVLLLVVGLWIWHRHENRPLPPAPPSRRDVGPTEAQVATSSAVVPAPRRRRDRSPLGGVALSVAVIVAGILAAAHVGLGAILASCLLVLGVALLVGSRWGRARLLVPLGLVLAVVAGVATVADVPLRGGAGDRTWRPAAVSQLAGEYHLGAGHAQLDLRNLDLAGGTRHVTMTLGMGHAEVWLPPGTSVHLHGHVGMGAIKGVGDDDGGVDVTRTEDVAGDRGHLVLDVKVGLGLLEVAR